MFPVAEGSDTVINETSRSTPHHGVTVFEAHAAHPIRATLAAPQKYSRHAERNGDDRRPGIVLITILVEAEFGACDITIDQAGVGIISGEPGFARSLCGNLEKR